MRICNPAVVYNIPDKFLESPVLALDEAVGALALHGLGLLPLGVEDAELELGPHLALVTRHCHPGHPSINQF
jgi:hypothetical protein